MALILAFYIICSYKCLLCPSLTVSPVPAAAWRDSNSLFPHTHPNHQAESQSGVMGGECGNVFSSTAKDRGSVCSKENNSIHQY